MGISIHSNAPGSSELRAVQSNAAHNLKIFKANANNSMACGVFVMNNANFTAIDYPCAEYTIVLEGEFRVEDEAKPGEAVTLKAGDVVRIDKGTKAKWSSPSTGKGESLSLLTQTFMPKPLTPKLVVIVGFYVTEHDDPAFDSGDLKAYLA